MDKYYVSYTAMVNKTKDKYSRTIPIHATSPEEAEDIFTRHMRHIKNKYTLLSIEEIKLSKL